LELFSAPLPVKVFKTLNGRQSKKSQAILKCFFDLKSSVFQKQWRLSFPPVFRGGLMKGQDVMTSNVACHGMLWTENSNEHEQGFAHPEYACTAG